MKRRRPPLTGLLRVRRARERQAAAELAGARAAEAAARAHLDEVRERQGAGVPLAESLRPAQLRALQLQGLGSREVLREAARQYEEARRTAADAASGWRQRKADADAAERIAAERRRREAARAARVAERSLDDLAAMMQRRGKP